MKRFRVLFLCLVLCFCSVAALGCGSENTLYAEKNSYDYFRENDFLESKKASGTEALYTISSNKRMYICVGYNSNMPIIIDGFYCGEDNDTIFLFHYYPANLEKNFSLNATDDVTEFIKKNIRYFYKSNIVYFSASS